MTRSLRIAAQIGARVYGGAEKATVEILRGLRDRGHEVRAFCQSDALVERVRSEGLDATPGPLGGQLMLPHALRFGLQLRGFAPHALLLATFKKSWLGSLAARIAGVPRVVARIGLDTDLPSRHWTYRVAFQRWIDVVVANADGIRRDIVRDMPSLDPRRVVTVYAGVRVREGTPPPRDEARRALDLPENGQVVGSLVRLSGQKRIDRMLDVAALTPSVHFALAGSGELEGELKERARAMGLEERIHFLGYRRDVDRVLAALDVLALTSDKEGLANAMLEAMAAGVPVVSTPVSGAEEALGDQGDGARAGVVAPFDPHGFAGALQALLADPGERDRLAREGQRRAATRFAYPVAIDAWEAILGGADPWPWHAGRPDD